MSSYVQHARRELQLAGEFERDPVYATTVLSAIAVLETLIGGDEVTSAIAREQIAVLLRSGTLSPLSDDPQEWAERSAAAGRPLWQSTRNPFAYSEDGGRTYWLLADRKRYAPDPPPTYPTVTRGPGALAPVIALRPPAP